MKLEEGSLLVGEAKFNFNGIFVSKKQGYLDLSVTGSDEGLSFFSFFLSDEGMKNLKSGNLLFEGSVKGKTFVEFPSTEVYFGLKDVKLSNPITKREIKNLNLKANFFSGKSDDWSEAKLVIDTLYADLPDGVANLSGSVHNFKSPEINLNIFLSADVTGLESVFKLGPISDLKGKLVLTDRIKGKYLIKEKKFVSENKTGRLYLENFGVKIPETITFDKVNGVIRRENEDFYFDSLDR